MLQALVRWSLAAPAPGARMCRDLAVPLHPARRGSGGPQRHGDHADGRAAGGRRGFADWVEAGIGGGLGLPRVPRRGGRGPTLAALVRGRREGPSVLPVCRQLRDGLLRYGVPRDVVQSLLFETVQGVRSRLAGFEEVFLKLCEEETGLAGLDAKACHDEARSRVRGTVPPAGHRRRVGPRRPRSALQHRAPGRGPDWPMAAGMSSWCRVGESRLRRSGPTPGSVRSWRRPRRSGAPVGGRRHGRRRHAERGRRGWTVGLSSTGNRGGGGRRTRPTPSWPYRNLVRPERPQSAPAAGRDRRRSRVPIGASRLT